MKHTTQWYDEILSFATWVNLDGFTLSKNKLQKEDNAGWTTLYVLVKETKRMNNSLQTYFGMVKTELRLPGGGWGWNKSDIRTMMKSFATSVMVEM